MEQDSGLPVHLTRHLQVPARFTQREMMDDGLLICFNTRPRQPGDASWEPEWLRVWIESDRVITIRSGPSADCDSLHAAASRQKTDWAPGDVFAWLVRNNVVQMEPLISSLVGRIGNLEDQFLVDPDEVDELELNRIRHTTIGTRRHFVEMRNLVLFILSDETGDADQSGKRSLVTARNHILTYLETLEDCRDRARLLHDQMESRMANRLNRITHNLTLLATVFLPLSFLTGLLGMNVAGIPADHNPWGFALVCGGMVIIATGFWIFLRWRRWT